MYLELKNKYHLISRKKHLKYLFIFSILTLTILSYIFHYSNSSLDLIKQLDNNSNKINKNRHKRFYDLKKNVKPGLIKRFECDKKWDRHVKSMGKSIDPGQKNRIAIFGLHRTGSTLLGRMLKAGRDDFYLFEPLRFMGPSYFSDELHKKSKFNKAVDVMANVFECKLLDKSINKMKIIWKKSSQDSLQKCQSSKNFIVKFVRADLNLAKSLNGKLKNSSTNPLKVLVLFRDPRGVLNSRLNPKLRFCARDNQCTDSRTICEHFRSFIKALVNFKRKSNKILENLVIVRYEDLLRNTTPMVRQLYQKLGLTFSPKVRTFITTQMNELSKNGPKREPKDNGIFWTQTFQKKGINLNLFQKNCLDVMQFLGYRNISQEEFESTNALDYSRLINDDFPLKRILPKNFIDF